MTVGIVILNYLNWNDTVECLESLANQTLQDYQAVVVDNHSSNESFDELNRRYGNADRIHLLQTKDNLGFAKGNNVGIVYCKEELNLKNILVINNDVIFTDENYLQTLVTTEYGEDVGAVGTKIIGSDGKNQNPVYLQISLYNITKHLVEPYLREKNFGRMLDGTRKLVRVVKKTLKKQKDKKQVDFQQPTHQNSEPKKENYLLHGSAIYFTEAYLNEMDGFYPETFLYYEENILGVVFEKMKLRMLYLDTTEIYHKEDQSSNLSFNNQSSVKNRWIRESVKIALKVRLSSVKKIKSVTNNYGYQYLKSK